MKLGNLLSKKRSVILKRWLDSILETYPADTQRFLKKRNDRFDNPVGYTLSEQTECLYAELIDERDIEPSKVSPILDRIIRIRTVQDFSPSQAVAFILALKKVIREELKGGIRDNDLSDELLIFHEKIDEMALIAFDIYMKCREEIFEIRVNQAKNQISGLLRKKGLICEIPEWSPHKQEGDVA